MSVLDEILAHKRTEISERKSNLPLDEVRRIAESQRPVNDFVSALRAAPSQPALIAEIKRASPSQGVLLVDFEPLRLARLYIENGASAISVLTDSRFFQGHLRHLETVRERYPHIPLLCKDFICDAYQIYEARSAGADAVLLITAALSQGTLRKLYTLTRQSGMAALIEVHTAEELERALELSPELVGINNRDLSDFSIDLETTTQLRAMIPEDVCVVAESGIYTPEDVERVSTAGANAILVGESLVRAADIGEQVRLLAGT